jgi:hypothetical protein
MELSFVVRFTDENSNPWKDQLESVIFFIVPAKRPDVGNFITTFQISSANFTDGFQVGFLSIS